MTKKETYNLVMATLKHYENDIDLDVSDHKNIKDEIGRSTIQGDHLVKSIETRIENMISDNANYPISQFIQYIGGNSHVSLDEYKQRKAKDRERKKERKAIREAPSLYTDTEANKITELLLVMIGKANKTTSCSKDAIVEAIHKSKFNLERLFYALIQRLKGGLEDVKLSKYINHLNNKETYKNRDKDILGKLETIVENYNT